MTENLPKDGVQSRQAVAQRCCLKALMKVRPMVKRIVGLTGTPSSNGLMDLFAEFKLLDKGQRLGRFFGQYRSTYFQPDKMNGMIVYSYKPLPKAELQAALTR